MIQCRDFVRRTFVFFVVLFLFASVFGQTSDAWYYGKKIRNIEFKGLQNVNSMELSGVTAPFIGKEFNDELYIDLLNKVYALDLFEDISPTALPGDAKSSTVVVEFTVTEKPFVSKLKFTGNRHIRASELKEAISTKEKDIYNSSKILLDEYNIICSHASISANCRNKIKYCGRYADSKKETFLHFKTITPTTTERTDVPKE